MRHAGVDTSSGRAKLTPEAFAAAFLHEGVDEGDNAAGQDAFDNEADFEDDAGPPELLARSASLFRCCAMLQTRLNWRGAVGIERGATSNVGGERTPLLVAPPAPIMATARTRAPVLQEVKNWRVPAQLQDWAAELSCAPRNGETIAGADGCHSALLSLAEDLDKRLKLAAISVTDVGIQPTGAVPLLPRCLAVVLRHCSNLRTLCVARCPSLAADPRQWASFLAALQNSRLSSLALVQCHLRGTALSQLSDALMQQTRNCDGHGLQVLILNNNDFGDTAGALANAILQCPRLRCLSLATCGLAQASAHSLSAALAHAECQLTRLDVSDNPALGTPGCRLLCDALAVNTCLQRLDMRQCGMDAGAVRHLAAGLRANCSSGGALHHVDVSLNALGASLGSPAMVDMLRDVASKLQVLDVSRNGVPGDVWKRMQEAVLASRSETGLVLRCNGAD